MNNLPTIKQQAQLILGKSKSLMKITNKILSYRSNLLVETPKYKPFVQTEHTRVLNCFAFSPDGGMALSWSCNDTLMLLDVYTGKVIRIFEMASGPVNSVAFSPDMKTVIAGCLDGSLQLWNISTGKVIQTFEGHMNWICSVAFSPDGKKVLSGGGHDTLKLWEISTGDEIQIFHWNIIYNDNTELEWDEYVSYEGVFSPDGKTVLLEKWDNTLILLDISTGRVIRTFYTHTGGIHSVTFSSDGKMLLYGSGDNTLKLWDISSGDEIRTFEGHTDIIISISFSPDGKTLLSGSGDNTLKLWDINTGKDIRTFEGNASMIHSVAFSPDGKIAFSGTIDGILTWDISTGKLIQTAVTFIDGEWITITPDGYFNHSTNGRQYLNVLTSPMNAIAIDDVTYNHYYRPNILTGATEDEEWIKSLWDWADSNDIKDLEWIDDDSQKNNGYWKGFPRDSDKVISLRELRLSSYNLACLPKEISSLIDLTEINLSGNCFEIIPTEVFNLENLVHLYADENQLSKLPKEIGNLVNLENFGLNKNNLLEIPIEIGNLLNLVVLFLGENQLSEIPVEIGNLSNLTVLFLSNNQLSKLPKEIGNLVNLEYLFLDTNQLLEIPKEIGNLSSLKILLLSKNQLSKLPIDIENLVDLKMLSIANNPLLILSDSQKEWINNLKEHGCNVIMDDDLLDRKAQKGNPHQDLILELACIFEDYRKDEGLNPNPAIVERWINQFSPHNQGVILSEMIHIFKRMYVSEQKVDDFLLGLTINSTLTNANPSHFWKNISLLNIQQDGESQKIMIEKFRTLILNQFGINVAINDFSKDHYIYVDDLLFSGMKLRTDLTYFLERAPFNAKIDVIYIGYFTSGEYYVKEKWFKSNNHKNIMLNVWRMFELENRNNCNHASDILLPTVETIKDEQTIVDFIQSQGRWVTRDVNGQSTYKCAGNNLFSSEENRKILEKEFTLAGLKINSSIGNQNKKAYWKPLGLSTFKGLGFGAMITTYRNCPNNTPLALWWGDWSDNQVWTPLFIRKTYNRSSINHE
jgi:WD40 repeat protein